MYISDQNQSAGQHAELLFLYKKNMEEDYVYTFMDMNLLVFSKERVEE